MIKSFASTAADAATGILPVADLLELAGKTIEKQQPACQRLAGARDELDGLERLYDTDDTNNGREDALCCTSFRKTLSTKEAVIAG
jgi:hypothetical protein